MRKRKCPWKGPFKINWYLSPLYGFAGHPKREYRVISATGRVVMFGLSAVGANYVVNLLNKEK